MIQSNVIKVDVPAQVGAARREASLLAQRTGFDATTAGAVAIVVTEAANNLIKHAGGGDLLLRQLRAGSVTGLEVLSIDSGPGMPDVAKCLKDGYSTAGSPGTGLGAISRLSTVFDVYSAVEQGTVLVAQFWPQALRKTETLQHGAVCLPMHPGEPCGDSWALFTGKDVIQVLVVDGLGHGAYAAQAANEAVRVFHERAGNPPTEIIQAMHGALRSTRGASLAVAHLDTRDHSMRFVGVGNIAAALVRAGGSRGAVSNSGIVGYEMPSLKEFTYPREPDEALIMHSDGLMTRWHLNKYPGLLSRHPSILAGVLYRDFRRGYDDITVLVLRDNWTGRSH